MTASALDPMHCRLGGVSLIEASAGTGKTWNICSLYLRILLERGLSVDRILVVTFTNAATAELRERIRHRLSEALGRLRPGPSGKADDAIGALLEVLRTDHGRTDDELRGMLEAALQTFDEAAILTIHAFCERALRDIPFGAAMPLSLELITDDREILDEVAQDFWRNEVGSAILPPGLAAELVARKDCPERFAAYLRQRVAKPLSRIEWGEAQPEEAEVATGELDRLHSQGRALWAAERDVIVAIVKAALPDLNKGTYKPSAIDTAARSWDAYFAEGAAIDADESGDKLDLLSSACLASRTNKGRQPPTASPFFVLATALLAEKRRLRIAAGRARLELLRRLVTEGPRVVRDTKSRRRLLSFDDMLFNLYERLTDGRFPELAGQLRARFPAALIDEFQDTDPLQFGIFEAIYSGHEYPLFLVGDPKQAIYSFRNADLQVYLRARRGASATYTLAANQRSSRGLLAGLNALFARNPRAFQQDGLDYVPLAYGEKQRQELSDRTLPRAPLQLWRLPEAAGGALVHKDEARRRAAEACSGEIARLLAAADAGRIQLANRRLAAGDIAILVRSHREGRLMRNALEQLGIGCVELSQASIFTTVEARELAQVMASALEPSDLPRLRAAVGTSLLGFDAAAVESLGGDEIAMLAWLERMGGYRTQWLQQGIGVMLRRMLVDLQIGERLLASAAGERRLTNVLHLVEILHTASVRQATPTALLAWFLGQIADPDRDDSTQLRLESDSNLVQIVTVHKAKGLEFPVVFCPFLWDGRRGPSGRDGIGLEYHDADGRCVLDFRALTPEEAKPLKEHRDREEDAERLRLVYVALTRAANRCYLVVGTYGTRTNGGLSAAEGNRSLLNWLVAGASMAPEEWRVNRLTAADIRTAWAGVADSCSDSIALTELPADAGAELAGSSEPARALAALAPPAGIPAGWWIGSYSRLAYGAADETAANDHDIRATVRDAGPTTRAELAAAYDHDDILGFPRGAMAGECIHALFERIDFTRPASWSAAIDAVLAGMPVAAVDSPQHAGLSAMLGRMLRDVLSTTLPFGIRLNEVPQARRLVELEFSLPARQLADHALTALLRDRGYPLPTLRFGTLQGYLRGFIDLVFEWRGRYFILDWKSNHLGNAREDYAEAPVRAAMRSHGYHLQHLLYTVAAHRYLSQRVPAYAYDTHFGGVLYLFVRGVRPDWRHPDGSCYGVFADRAPATLVEAISRLLGTPDAAV
jgi:exodeoxyribonuclease V beta subunit